MEWIQGRRRVFVGEFWCINGRQWIVKTCSGQRWFAKTGSGQAQEKFDKKIDVTLAVTERRPRSDQAAKDFPVRFDRAAANAARAVERGRGVTCAQPTLARVHLRELQENASLFWVLSLCLSEPILVKWWNIDIKVDKGAGFSPAAQ
jgi:hypothetical protein